MSLPLSGRSVLIMLIAFFGAVFAANALFIVKAVTTFRGEDEANSYMQGIDYNRTLEKREMQKTLGWRAAIAAKREMSGRILVTAAISSAAGAPLERLSLIGVVRHPSDARRDRQVAFAEKAPGFYSADVAGIPSGAWDIVLSSAGARQPPFEAERRLWLP